jgi:phage/plasmid-associated DNA primase
VEFPALAVEPNPDIKEAIKLEGPGILLWALEGLRRLRQRGGFDVPDSVEAATEAYRRSNDIAAEFVADMGIESNPDSLCPASVLIRAYNTWRRVHGYSPVSERSAATDWKRLGFEKVRRGNGQNYCVSPAVGEIRSKAARYAV